MQFRLKPVTAALMFAVMGGLSINAQAVEVAAGALDAALRGLASESGIQILFDANELKGAKTSGVRNAASPEDALRKVLEGSGYSFQSTGNKSFVIRKNHLSKDSVMDPIVVAATRTEERLSRVAASVNVASREEFQEQQATAVGDVLKKMPNVSFGGGPRTDGAIPTIRGYQGASITLLVDGARRNDTTSGASNPLRTSLFVEPYFLKKAEVVRGSASSLYGPGGNGGAMVFTTVSAKDMLKSGESLGSSFQAGYADGNKTKSLKGMIYKQGEQLDALVGVAYQDFDWIRQGGGTYLSPNSGHALSGLLKLGMQTSDRVRVELTHDTYQKQALMPNNAQVNTAAQTQLNHIVQNDTVLKLSRTSESGEKGLEGSIYHSGLKSQNDKNPLLPALAFTINQTDTVGTSIQNTNRLSGDTHRLTYGLDYFQDKQAAISGAAPNGVTPNGTRKVTGLFIQDEISLGAFHLTPSVRSDSYSTSVANGATPASSNSHISPKIAAMWDASENLSLYGSYGESFRAPTLSEMYMNSQAPLLFKFSPNTNLQAEIDKTFEIGTNFNKQDLFTANDKFKFRAAAFKSKASNMITQVVIGTFPRLPPFNLVNSGYGVGIGANFQAQNVASAKRSGIELSGGYQTGLWDLGANYGKVRVTDANNGNNLFSPPDKLALQVRRSLAATDLSISWNTNAVAAQNYDSTILRRRNGYTVHDLYMSWEPQTAQKLRVDFGIANVLDKRYFDYQSSNALANVAEMGRNVKVALTADF
jgi:hemoglobin/transferrin/lactoferrin receptor protein